MISTLLKLFHFIEKEDRKRIILLVILSFLASIAELISIGSILPLISIVISPEKIISSQLARDLFNILNISSNKSIVLFIFLFYIIIVIASGLIRLLQVYAQARFCHNIGAKISNEIFYNSLTQNYYHFIISQSNALTNIIMIKINSLVFDVLIPFFNLLSSYMMFIFIVTALLFVEFNVTLIVFSLFTILFALIYSTSRNRVRKDSITISEGLDNLQKILLDSNGSFVDIKINNLYNYFIQIFSEIDSNVRNARARVQLFISLPRIGIESIGLVLISIFLLIGFNNNEELINSMPLIAFFALSLQKLLPITNSIYSSSSLILSNYKSIDDIIKYKNKLVSEDIFLDYINNDLNKWTNLELQHIEYQFNNNDKIINRLSLTINKGDRIGIIGSSGSGKTTLLNIILGLIKPTSGSYYVDGLSIWPSNYLLWRNEFSYVSQNIYLADESIAYNITLGTEQSKIDHLRLLKVCEVALINEFASNFGSGIDAKVGERGNLLSGGQRQRIAIARALYKKSSILVLDEATSALDSKSESQIIDNINSFDPTLTIIMVAHRINSLKYCKLIYRLENKKINKILL